MSIEEIRLQYQQRGMDRADLHDDPIKQFTVWFEDAQTHGPQWLEVDAASLATADRAGNVSARMVLLKGIGRDGFQFFTNYRSAKAQQMEQNPHAALLFYWPYVARQIRIEGMVTKLDAQLSDAYFEKRPIESRLSAVASPQSEEIASRQDLEDSLRRLREQLATMPVKRPEHWGGYLLTPRRMEFWQGRAHRLHDRFAYLPNPDGGWNIVRLAP